MGIVDPKTANFTETYEIPLQSIIKWQLSNAVNIRHIDAVCLLMTSSNTESQLMFLKNDSIGSSIYIITIEENTIALDRNVYKILYANDSQTLYGFDFVSEFWRLLVYSIDINTGKTTFIAQMEMSEDYIFTYPLIDYSPVTGSLIYATSWISRSHQFYVQVVSSILILTSGRISIPHEHNHILEGLNRKFCGYTFAHVL